MMPTPSYNLIVCLVATKELCMAGGNPIRWVGVEGSLIQVPRGNPPPPLGPEGLIEKKAVLLGAVYVNWLNKKRENAAVNNKLEDSIFV